LVHRCDDWGDVSTGLIHLELYGVMIEGRPRRPSIFFGIFVIPWICEIYPKLPSGTYVYTLKYALGSAPSKTLNGTVTLIRKEP
jgi:hypothetical protein